jgi:hypothetical protein
VYWKAATPKQTQDLITYAVVNKKKEEILGIMQWEHTKKHERDFGKLRLVNLWDDWSEQLSHAFDLGASNKKSLSAETYQAGQFNEGLKIGLLALLRRIDVRQRGIERAARIFVGGQQWEARLEDEDQYNNEDSEDDEYENDSSERFLVFGKCRKGRVRSSSIQLSSRINQKQSIIMVTQCFTLSNSQVVHEEGRTRWDPAKHKVKSPADVKIPTRETHNGKSKKFDWRRETVEDGHSLYELDGVERAEIFNADFLPFWVAHHSADPTEGPDPVPVHARPMEMLLVENPKYDAAKKYSKVPRILCYIAPHTADHNLIGAVYVKDIQTGDKYNALATYNFYSKEITMCRDRRNVEFWELYSQTIFMLLCACKQHHVVADWLLRMIERPSSNTQGTSGPQQQDLALLVPSKRPWELELLESSSEDAKDEERLQDIAKHLVDVLIQRNFHVVLAKEHGNLHETQDVKFVKESLGKQPFFTRTKQLYQRLVSADSKRMQPVAQLREEKLHNPTVASTHPNVLQCDSWLRECFNAPKVGLATSSIELVFKPASLILQESGVVIVEPSATPAPNPVQGVNTRRKFFISDAYVIITILSIVLMLRLITDSALSCADCSSRDWRMLNPGNHALRRTPNCPASAASTILFSQC